MTNFERPVVVNVMFLNVYSGFRHFRKDSGRYVLGRGFLLVVVDDSQLSLERPTRSSGRATVWCEARGSATSFCKKKQYASVKIIPTYTSTTQRSAFFHHKNRTTRKSPSRDLSIAVENNKMSPLRPVDPPDPGGRPRDPTGIPAPRRRAAGTFLSSQDSVFNDLCGWCSPWSNLYASTLTQHSPPSPCRSSLYSTAGLHHAVCDLRLTSRLGLSSWPAM